MAVTLFSIATEAFCWYSIKAYQPHALHEYIKQVKEELSKLPGSGIGVAYGIHVKTEAAPSARGCTQHSGISRS